MNNINDRLNRTNRIANLVSVLSVVGSILIVSSIFTLTLESKWLTFGLMGLGVCLMPLPVLFDRH